MDKNEILNSNSDVRRVVAGYPNLPFDVLAELAKDSEWLVRNDVAGNTSTPADVLAELG